MIESIFMKLAHQSALITKKSSSKINARSNSSLSFLHDKKDCQKAHSNPEWRFISSIRTYIYHACYLDMDGQTCHSLLLSLLVTPTTSRAQIPSSLPVTVIHTSSDSLTLIGGIHKQVTNTLACQCLSFTDIVFSTVLSALVEFTYVNTSSTTAV